MIHNTYFQPKTGKYVEIKSSYSLVRKYITDNTSDLIEIEEKLDRLKDENFNRISVPDFTYRIKNNVVVVESEFIKNKNEIAIISRKKEIIEDVVLRKSDWTFIDYHDSNFIIHETSNHVYSIDLLSYSYFPNIEERKSHWNFWQNRFKKDVNKFNEIYDIFLFTTDKK